MLSTNFKPKRTAAASRGFLATRPTLSLHYLTINSIMYAVKTLYAYNQHHNQHHHNDNNNNNNDDSNNNNTVILLTFILLIKLLIAEILMLLL